MSERTPERRNQNRRRHDKHQEWLLKTNLAAWLALVASIGTAVAFFDRLHEDYVTRAELYKWMLDERGKPNGHSGKTVFHPDWKEIVNHPVASTGKTDR